MNSRLRKFVVILPALIVSVSVGIAGEISADLKRRMAAGTAGELHGIIITLRDKGKNPVALEGARSGDRHERKIRVVRQLRRQAESAQGEVRPFLERKRREGKVSNPRYFWVFNGIACSGTTDLIEELAHHPAVADITEDRIVKLSAPVSPAAVPVQPGWNIARINVQPLWDMGITGAGTVVATLDSGVDLNQPELAASWRGGGNSWFDPSGEHAAPFDNDGHGSQVMGVMVGGNGPGGQPIGVAPGARWIAARIFRDDGTALYSDIHASFQWLLDPDGNPATPDAPDVVDLSWSLENPRDYDGAFEERIKTLRAAGIAVVAAAGNHGPAAGTSTSPANYAGVVSVGATDRDDLIASFSSRGPSARDGVSLFPLVSAPGDGVITTGLWFGTPEMSTVIASGTSYSAPHVAGIMALLLSANPALAPEQLNSAIEAGALDMGLPGGDSSYGAGFVDAGRSARLLGILPPLPTPSGDVDNDGQLTLADVILVLRRAVGQPQSVTTVRSIMNNGDVHPLAGPGGPPVPDARITLADVLILLRRHVGIVSW